MKENKNISLFFVFMKIGVFTFGGGYAMIPLIQREIVEEKKWISEEDLLDIVAIAESTPGPIAVNSASFVGYQVGGFIGSLVATLGVVLPSFIIIFTISSVLKQFEDLSIIRYAFQGIRAGVLALIIKALYSMYKKCPKSPVTYGIMLLAFLLSAVWKVNVLLIILICAFIGLLAFLLEERRDRE